MKRSILLICLLCIQVVCCQKFDDSEIWDNINSLDERVTALEKLCREMNTNIDAIQALVNALAKNDYITNVSPINDNGEVIGYTISFAYGDPITIYHGQDGADGAPGHDGADGADGHTPDIGVAKDSDGVYYWTVDGLWLLDSSGNKVPTTGRDGVDGVPGSDGSDGTDGTDGVTPQLKIEDGMWYVSYDGGSIWTEVGQATGDQGPQGETGATGPQGPQGEPGVGGDSMFTNVDYSSSDEYVTFVLSNGTELKIPTWSAFEALKQQCVMMNRNIEALQTIVSALQENDYVTGVTPIYEGVTEIGYVIAFSKSGSVTIYHGKDGQDGADGAPGHDGADGADGHTPVIGVAKDTDGVYYWTVDGLWLLDSSGNKVPTTGKDGNPGGNGADGTDGVTPQLKIEGGMWYVSYDGGSTWTEVGQATGDQGPQGETGATGPQGPQGEPGVGGDSMFANVDYSSSDEYVTFVLSNGTELKIPTWSAFEALKQQCAMMNRNIEALQTIVSALQENDYVTGVTPIYEGVTEIGYIITFSKSGSVTIYHGKDGQDGADGAPGHDGADGADGHTPVIGVAKDSDGVYYWTVDGLWLLDSSGNKVPTTGKDGVDGVPGSDGSDGTDGTDGVTPQLKIEDGMWYVSYDDGSTWTEVGQATGDQGPQGETGATGSQGNPGQDGDSFFQSVTQDGKCVYLVLADGTEIILPRHPQDAVTISLGEVTGFTATFNGNVNRRSLDLKVTVYYGTTDNITVYKHVGSGSVTDFATDSFTLRLAGLAANTTYYYFIETVSNGVKSFTDVASFKTGMPDSYVDWEEGENVGGEI